MSRNALTSFLGGAQSTDGLNIVKQLLTSLKEEFKEQNKGVKNKKSKEIKKIQMLVDGGDVILRNMSRNEKWTKKSVGKEEIWNEVEEKKIINKERDEEVEDLRDLKNTIRHCLPHSNL